MNMLISGSLRSFVSGSVRYIHACRALQAVDKGSLSKLRKKTGFPFISCKKALEKFDNDIKEAEVWLREQAQKEGWAKATKLQGRPMSQGLIGVIVDQDSAAMVEVNCETDFVARNPKFLTLVSRAAACCLHHGQQTADAKVLLSRPTVNELVTEGGERLADLVALDVGNIGENMAVRRAVYIKAEPGSHIGSYVHATGPHIVRDNRCMMGRFGSLAVFNHDEDMVDGKLGSAELGRQLCQHIVGMNPTQLGSLPDEDATRDEDEGRNEGTARDEGRNENAARDKEEGKNEEEGRDEEEEKNEDQEEGRDTHMLHQEFLLEPSLTVCEFLAENSATIHDFIRFECGEDINEEEK